MAAELTVSSGDDASTVPALLDQIEVPIRRFTADGAYDHRSIYERVGAAGTEDVAIVIPPRRSAVSAGPTEGPWAQRRAALERIRAVGRRQWQKESGYRQQSRVENGFFRYKSVLGGGLQARNSKRAKERGHDRVSHPQPDGRSRQAEVVRRGAVNEGLGKRLNSPNVESCNNAARRRALDPTCRDASVDVNLSGELGGLDEHIGLKTGVIIDAENQFLATHVAGGAFHLGSEAAEAHGENCENGGYE